MKQVQELRESSFLVQDKTVYVYTIRFRNPLPIGYVSLLYNKTQGPNGYVVLSSVQDKRRYSMRVNDHRWASLTQKLTT